MRKELTPPERALWNILRANRFHDTKFRRQVVIGNYIADFACRNPSKLVIELDGDTHAIQQEYDQRRTESLERHGYRIVRFSNREVLNNCDGVLMAIKEILYPPLLTSPLKGRGI